MPDPSQDRTGPRPREAQAFARPEERTMDEGLRAALKLIVAKDDAGDLFDREADEGAYQSAELQDAVATLRQALGTS